MCSIAGSKDAAEVAEMLEVMKHRSPDGNRFIQGDFTMGMGRLAIIDIANKEFPFQIDETILSFNGEIYNYIELREELERRGHIFRTKGDTEVLLRSYLEWGVDCLERLNGMFAFAIKDGDTVFLARDIAGEKPLYYSREPFKFASEAKALKWNCVELPPAHYALYNLKSKLFKIKRWWKLPKLEILPERAEEELEWLLEDSIRLRTRSDVPYALYLSDGIDSNLIHSFSTGVDKRWSTFTYHDKLHFKQEFDDVIQRIVWHLDYPLDSFSSFALWKLAESASKNGFKVVLSGEGADELFGGYVRYVPNGMNAAARDKFPSYTKMFPDHGDLGWKDFNGKMRGLLRMGDRMSSAWGIENRCPFLDRRIIEFAFNLPTKVKCYGLDTKIVLRNVLRKRNPNYQEPEKHGLFVRVNEWLGVDDPLEKLPYLNLQMELWEKSQS